jgi:hypothetical protein
MSASSVCGYGSSSRQNKMVDNVKDKIRMYFMQKERKQDLMLVFPTSPMSPSSLHMRMSDFRKTASILNVSEFFPVAALHAGHDCASVYVHGWDLRVPTHLITALTTWISVSRYKKRRQVTVYSGYGHAERRFVYFRIKIGVSRLRRGAEWVSACSSFQ